MYKTDDVRRSINIVESTRKDFSFNYLFMYLDRLNIPSLSQLIRNDVSRLSIKNSI